MGCDPLNVQLFERTPNLRQLLLGSVAMMDGPRRDLKQASLVGVDRHRSPMLLDIATQLSQVLLRRIMTHETCRQSRGGIIDHGDQVELLAAPFQPVVFTGIPLHQLAITSPPSPPYVRLFDPRSVRLPHLRLGQPLPPRVPPNLDPVALA